MWLVAKVLEIIVLKYMYLLMTPNAKKFSNVNVPEKARSSEQLVRKVDGEVLFCFCLFVCRRKGPQAYWTVVIFPQRLKMRS